MPNAVSYKNIIKLPSLNILLEGLPKRDKCKCGAGLPGISFDFEARTWSCWCGCGAGSHDMAKLEHAILDFNTKNKW